MIFSLEGLYVKFFRGSFLQVLLVCVFFFPEAGGWVWRFGYEGIDAVEFLFFRCDLKLVDALREFADLFIRFSNHFDQADEQLFD